MVTIGLVRTIETNVNTVKTNKGHLGGAIITIVTNNSPALADSPERLSYLQESLDYTVTITEQNESHLNLLKYRDTNVLSVHSKLKQEDGRFEASLGNISKTFSQKQINCSLRYAFQGS